MTTEQTITNTKNKILNSDRYLKTVDKYTEIQKLTPEPAREFIDKIVVHDRIESWREKNYT